jgi:hypothetical protein
LRNAYIILVGKREWKRPLGNPVHRLNKNIKLYLQQWKYVDWI